MLANSENLSDSQPGTGYKEQEGTNISSGLELELEGKQGRKYFFYFSSETCIMVITANLFSLKTSFSQIQKIIAIFFFRTMDLVQRKVSCVTIVISYVPKYHKF